MNVNDPRLIDPKEKFNYLLFEFFNTLDELQNMCDIDPRLDKDFEKALNRWIEDRE